MIPFLFAMQQRYTKREQNRTKTKFLIRICRVQQIFAYSKDTSNTGISKTFAAISEAIFLSEKKSGKYAEAGNRGQ